MHIHLNNTINDHLVKKVAKELDLAIDYNYITFLINSPGGAMHASDALIQLVRLTLDNNPELTINFVINGQCCSAAVDFVMSFRDNERVTAYISKYSEVMVHKMRVCSIDSYPSDLQKLWRDTMKDEIKATITSYSPYLTKAQINDIQRNKDVYIGYKVAAKMFNAKII